MPNLDDLRGVLFEQLKRIQDPKEKFDASRTRAITDIAGRLLESARLEIDYARATKKAGLSKFLAGPESTEKSVEALEEKPKTQPWQVCLLPWLQPKTGMIASSRTAFR